MKVSVPIAAAGVVALAGAAFLLATNPMRTPEEDLTRACEAILAERLTAPSTYRRLGVRGWLRESADRDEFLKIETGEKRQRHEAQAAASPAYSAAMQSLGDVFDSAPMDRIGGVVSFEASNDQGILTQGRFVCSLFLASGEEIAITPTAEVRVNNMTAIDWTTESIRLLTE